MGLTLCSQLFLCSTDLRVQVTDLSSQLLYLPLKLFLLSSLTLALSLLQLSMQKHQQIKNTSQFICGFLTEIIIPHCVSSVWSLKINQALHRAGISWNRNELQGRKTSCSLPLCLEELCTLKIIMSRKLPNKCETHSGWGNSVYTEWYQV